MHDDSVNPPDERDVAAFLDRLVAGEPGDAGVDPALAEAARDLQDRAARSTVSAPPAGTLAAIRADLFDTPVTPSRSRAALGIVPGAALMTRPAVQLALAAAILLAIVTGFAAFRSVGWLGHAPTGTHSALAASATAPTMAQLAMSPEYGARAASVVRDTTIPAATQTGSLAPDVKALLQTCPMPESGAIPGIEMARLPWTVGQAPYWVVGASSSSGPGAQQRLPYASFLTNKTTLYSYTSPDLQSPVTVTLHRTDGAQLSPTPEKGQMRIDPNIAHGKSGQSLARPGAAQMWALSTTLPGTGCYELSAQWAGGNWTIRFPIVVEHPSTASNATPGSATPIASPVPATPSASVTCPMPDAKAVNFPIGVDGQVVHAWGLGDSPLWLVGLGKTPAWYHPTDPGFVIRAPNEAPGATMPGTASINVLWLMDPKHPQPVNVRGKGIDNGPDLYFQTVGSKEADFTQGGVPGRVYMWWTSVIYTQPGCYEITATWASGSWTIRLPLPAPGNALASPPACATPGATPVLPGSPANPAQSLAQPPPPFATRQPPIPYITPGIQQIATRPGLPLITPTPFATIIVPFATPATPSPACSG